MNNAEILYGKLSCMQEPSDMSSHDQSVIPDTNVSRNDHPDTAIDVDVFAEARHYMQSSEQLTNMVYSCMARTINSINADKRYAPNYHLELAARLMDALFKVNVDQRAKLVPVEKSFEVGQPIDQRFIFDAINLANGNRYSRTDAVVLTIYDQLITEILSMYLVKCDEFGVDESMKTNIRNTLHRLVLKRSGMDGTKKSLSTTVIDRKFEFRAVAIDNPITVYGPDEAIVFCAKDRVFAAALEAVIALNGDTLSDKYREAITALCKLVFCISTYQRDFESAIHDIVGEDEIRQCLQ